MKNPQKRTLSPAGLQEQTNPIWEPQRRCKVTETEVIHLGMMITLISTPDEHPQPVTLRSQLSEKCNF